jgi:hypothetical protein
LLVLYLAADCCGIQHLIPELLEMSAHILEISIGKKKKQQTQHAQAI